MNLKKNFHSLHETRGTDLMVTNKNCSNEDSTQGDLNKSKND